MSFNPCSCCSGTSQPLQRHNDSLSLKRYCKTTVKHNCSLLTDSFYCWQLSSFIPITVSVICVSVLVWVFCVVFLFFFFIMLSSNVNFCMEREGKVAVYQAMLSGCDAGAPTQEGYHILGVITLHAFSKTQGTK